MKNRECVFVFLLVMLLIASAYLFVKYKDAEKMQKSAGEILNNFTDNYRLLSAYHTNRCHEFTLNGILIDANEIVSDTNSGQYRIADVLGDRAFIFRYSSTDCLQCIEAQLEIINNIPDSVGLNIIFLASHPSDLEMKRFIKLHKIIHRVYNMSDALQQKIKDIGNPYYFVIDKNNLRLNKVFVPMKESPQLTQQYLDSVLSIN